LSRPSYHDTEHEEAALTAEPALEEQRAIESLIERSSNPQQDTPDTLDSTRSGDSQAEPRDTPDIHPGDEGERSDQTSPCEGSLEEATNRALEPAPSVEEEQHVAQPLVQNVGEKGDRDERIYGNEEE
jgi:hypothetical protein